MRPLLIWTNIGVAVALVAAQLVLADGVAAAVPDEQPFKASHYQFLGDTNDAGTAAKAYITVPTGGKPGPRVQAWMLYAFTSPLSTDKGVGAFSISLQTYDCGQHAVRTDRAELYGLHGERLDLFDSPQPFVGPLPPGSVGLEALGIVCSGGATGATLPNLAATLDDAKARAAARP